MQQVERGKLQLERPASDVLPALEAAKVLEGFDQAGKPRLRAPKRPITLRHLLTHTAGFSYEIWSAAIAKFQEVTGTPGITTCANAALGTPLLFDPGDRWDYGINIDWAGKMVEAASGQRLDRYLHDNVTGPLGMTDTAFKLGASQKARLSAMHQRNPDGTLAAIEFGLPEDIPRFHRVFGPPPDDPNFNRLNALAHERRGSLEAAHKHWQQFEQDIARNTAVWPGDEGPRARALVWQHMGHNADDAEEEAGEDEDELYPRFRPPRPKPLKPGAAECFRRAVSPSSPNE